MLRSWRFTAKRCLRTGRLDHGARRFRGLLQAEAGRIYRNFLSWPRRICGRARTRRPRRCWCKRKKRCAALRKEVRASRATLTGWPRPILVHCLLAEVVAKLYEELNRETKYFDALVRLFDLYLGAGRLKEACESLDRLVDIDPYDYRNQERISKLEGKADPAFLQNILARAAKAATVSTRTDGFTGAGREPSENSAGIPEELRAQQALEDLIVQVEIFLQYSLQSKAVERLERIAELFPRRGRKK